METLHNNYGLSDIKTKINFKTRPVYRSTLITNVNGFNNNTKESPITPRARSSNATLREPMLRTRTTVRIRAKADPSHRMSLNDYEKLQKHYQSLSSNSEAKRHSFTNLNRSRDPSTDSKSNISTPISLPIRRLDQESIKNDTKRISFREPIIKSSISTNSHQKEEINSSRSKLSTMNRPPIYHLDVKIKTNTSPYQSHARKNDKVSFISISFIFFYCLSLGILTLSHIKSLVTLQPF